MSSDRYDLVVIGGGPAGGKAATQAAYYQKRVAVVEKKPAPGGIAVSDAGILIKTLCETASYLTGFRYREIYGVSFALDARFKLDRLRSRTAEVVAVMMEAATDNLRNMGVDLIQGEGRLGDVSGSPKQVIVGDRTLLADVVLIATG